MLWQKYKKRSVLLTMYRCACGVCVVCLLLKNVVDGREYLPHPPPRLFAHTVVYQCSDTLVLGRVLSQKYKKGKHLEEKMKEKEMPPWWRYNEVRHPPTVESKT